MRSTILGVMLALGIAAMAHADGGRGEHLKKQYWNFYEQECLPALAAQDGVTIGKKINVNLLRIYPEEHEAEAGPEVAAWVREHSRMIEKLNGQVSIAVHHFGVMFSNTASLVDAYAKLDEARALCKSTRLEEMVERWALSRSLGY